MPHQTACSYILPLHVSSISLEDMEMLIFDSDLMDCRCCELILVGIGYGAVIISCLTDGVSEGGETIL